MVDLVEAFYRVLRPLALGSSFTDAEVACIAQRLQLHPDVMQELQHHLQDESAVAAAGMTPHAQRLLQAIHSDTFFQMPGQSDVCRISSWRFVCGRCLHLFALQGPSSF